MLCRGPYIPAYGRRAAYPCGKCDSCMKDRNSLWQSRIILESTCHEKNCFVTLTYNDAHLPEGGTLVPQHVQGWIKRMRERVPRVEMDGEMVSPIRFYVAGEYGDKGGRPHYHAALFGLGIEDSAMVSDCWGMGDIHVGELTLASARYIASYVTKKMMKPDDERLNGRHPEFSRKSLCPGLGAYAMPFIINSLQTTAGKRYLHELGDVPYALKFGDGWLPLGRYLRSRLRKCLDLYTVDRHTGEVKYGAPHAVQLQKEAEMLSLYDAWTNDPKLKEKTFKQFLSAVDNGKYALLKQRLETSRRRKVL